MTRTTIFGAALALVLVSATVAAAEAEETQAGKPASGIRHLSHVVMVGGGIGVSGAPGGELDEKCAKAGIESIRDALEL